MGLPANLIGTQPRRASTEFVGRSAALAEALSARRLLAFVLACAVFMMTVEPITDPDFWWHLRTGQLIFETRAIPHADVFSFTARGWEWVAHEWLSELLMYTLYRAAGWGALIVFFSLVMTAALWLTFRRAVQRGAHMHVAGAATLLGAFATGPIWGVRPQMISFLFTSVFLTVLDGYARREQTGGERGRKLWLLVPLTFIWANMHGAFALGLGILAVACAGVVLDQLLSGGTEERADLRRILMRLRPLCAALAACVLIVPLNPNGPRLLAYPLETMSSHAMHKYIEEWFSPNFHLLIGQPFALLLLATFAALALSPKRVRPSELLLLSVAAYAGLRAWRNIPFFALVAVPVLAEHAWSLIESRGWLRRRGIKGTDGTGATSVLVLALNLTLLVCVPLGMCAWKVAGVVRGQAAVEAEKFPAAAVAFLREHAEAGPLYNTYGWGGYLIWKLYPERPVFGDGRADVYGDAFVEEYLSAESGERNWRATLDKYGVRTVLTRPDVPLASLLREDDSWGKVFEDEQSVIFFKR